MNALRFIVLGEPVGKERARAVTRTSKALGKTFTKLVTPPKTRSYEAHIRTLAQIAVNQSKWSWSKDDRFHVILRVFRTHDGVGGDLDNVIKAFGDALNGVAWKDDRYVRGIGAMLFQDAKRPRVEIEVRRVAKAAA